MAYHVAVDVGGTQLRAACFPVNELRPIKHLRIPTQEIGASPLERLISLITSAWPDDGQVQAIAVAVPGPTDPYKGIVIAAPNIPGWEDLPLKAILQDQFKVPVALGNDANMGALGEYHFGAGLGHHYLLYLTISTGIGSGVIIDDQLLLGSRGLAAELGHVTVLADGPLCGCGLRGHLEAISSGTAIVRWVLGEMATGVHTILPKDTSITAKLISQAAREGDELCVQAFCRAGRYLGIGLANFLHIFNPTAVIIGGGVSHSRDLWNDSMQAALHQNVLSSQYLDSLNIVPAALGDDAGLMGALALARSILPTPNL